MFDMILGALKATGIPFAAYGWDRPPAGTYGVFSIEGQEDSLSGDDGVREQGVRGSVDLFVQGVSTSGAETVQEAISSVTPSWFLNSVQYESDTGLVHYEWILNWVGL